LVASRFSILNLTVSPLLSVTMIENEDVPVPVGVPEIKPLVALSVNPAGSAPVLMT
jgi:hypothetical protein